MYNFDFFESLDTILHFSPYNDPLDPSEDYHFLEKYGAFSYVNVDMETVI